MCSLHLFALFSFFSPISCALVNVTIDDTNGDSITGTHITYNPFDAWQKGQDCTNCTALLNSDKLYDGTWHDASYNPVRGTSNSYPGTIISASVSFTGSAVYVICTLTGSTSSPDGNTDMTFIVDGSTAGTFERSPNGDTSYSFGQIVFAKSGLDQRKHTLSIESGHNGTQALVLLDRIVYTTDSLLITTTSSPSQPTATTDTMSPNTSHSDNGTIAGAVLGGFGAALLVVLLLWWLLARRRQQRIAAEKEAEKALQPFFGEPPSAFGFGGFGRYKGGITEPVYTSVFRNDIGTPSLSSQTWGQRAHRSPETPAVILASSSDISERLPGSTFQDNTGAQKNRLRGCTGVSSPSYIVPMHTKPVRALPLNPTPRNGRSYTGPPPPRSLSDTLSGGKGGVNINVHTAVQSQTDPANAETGADLDPHTHWHQKTIDVSSSFTNGRNVPPALEPQAQVSPTFVPLASQSPPPQFPPPPYQLPR